MGLEWANAGWGVLALRRGGRAGGSGGGREWLRRGVGVRGSGGGFGGRHPGMSGVQGKGGRDWVAGPGAGLERWWGGRVQVCAGRYKEKVGMGQRGGRVPRG